MGGLDRDHTIIFAAPNVLQPDFVAWLDQPEVLPQDVVFQNVQRRFVLLTSCNDNALRISMSVNRLAAIDGYHPRAGRSIPSLCQADGFTTVECGGARCSDFMVGHNYLFSSPAVRVRAVRFFGGGPFHDANVLQQLTRQINDQGPEVEVFVFAIYDPGAGW